MALAVKNPHANTGDTRDAGSIPGRGRSLEEGTATHSRGQRTLVGPGPQGHKELDMTEVT